MTERRTEKQERFAEQATTFAKKSWYDIFFDAVALREALRLMRLAQKGERLAGSPHEDAIERMRIVERADVLLGHTAYLEESDD